VSRRRAAQPGAGPRSCDEARLTVNVLIPSIAFGLISASVLAIAAVGFTLQFAVTNVLNLAYSAVMIASAFVAYAVNRQGVTIWVAALAAAAAGAALSLFLNRVIYTPFQRRKASPIAIVIVALGMTLIIEYGTQAIAGPTNVSYAMGQGATLSIGTFRLTVAQLAIIVLSIVLMLGVHVLMRYTRLGKAMRATAANRDLARNSGIRTDRVVSATWLVSGALCGLAGAVFAMDAGTFGATSTDLFLVLILAAVFLGGPGEPYGAMLGAVVIGLGTEVSAAFIVSDYKDVVAFVVLLAMLAVRPNGLLGARA
jgi:branched-subunit amino acid ABC-type transport system permease component